MATRVVRKRGEEVPLTLKEFSLLECFMRQPNEVLSREKLFDHVWDFNSLSWSNVLDVHMKNLRKKLRNHENGEQLFETVRGVGYRLAGEVHAVTSYFRTAVHIVGTGGLCPCVQCARFLLRCATPMRHCSSLS
jgi:DNA-binding winged helix-turn-helix (wHTH) protein